MFAVLNFYEDKKGISSLFSGDKITSHRHLLDNDEVFFTVDIKKRRGKIPWKKLEKCLGILSQDVLLPKEITIPQNINITKFSPEKYNLILFFSSAAKHIRANKQIFGSLCVYDQKGLFLPFVESLITSFSVIKIISPFLDEYEKLSEELLDKYGASLLITKNGKLCGDIIISPQSNLVDLTFSGTLYTISGRRLLSGRVLCPQKLILPNKITELCPENIDEIDFAGALYEKCAIEDALKGEYCAFS